MESNKHIVAIQAFRNLAGLPQTMLTFRCIAPNPYKDDESKTVAIYNAQNDYEFWVDTADNTLVQAGPSARVHSEASKIASEDRLTVKQLRAKAVSIIEGQIPTFIADLAKYHPLEDNRHRQTYFFRWDDFGSPAKDTELPPFVQVGLHADGSLASYTNTLIRETVIKSAKELDCGCVINGETGERIGKPCESVDGPCLYAKPAFVIPAKMVVDATGYEVHFDALPWFEKAKDEEIEELSDDAFRAESADGVARFCADEGTELAEIFALFNDHACDPRICLETHSHGFEVYVDKEKAKEWVKDHCPLVKL